MQNKESMLVQLNVEDLQKLIKEALKEEITKITDVIKLNSKTSENESEVLTREETAKLLNVSFTSLYHWNKDGSLPAKKINHKVYYQRSMIMDKLNCRMM